MADQSSALRSERSGGERDGQLDVRWVFAEMAQRRDLSEAPIARASVSKRPESVGGRLPHGNADSDKEWTLQNRSV